MIKIDFHGSTHGHFLEYVVNVYIMQTLPSKVNIFKPPTYSAHAPDRNYLNNRIAICGHYSSSGQTFTDNKVVRIMLDSKDDDLFFIAITNLMHKAGDIGFEKQSLSVPESIRNDPVAYRNQWYSKFNERETFANFYTEFSATDCPVFDFSFKSFFSFGDFCVELAKLSNFLDQTFFPDQSLYELWCNFIVVNQGYQSYIKCNQLLNGAFSNCAYNMNCDVIEQGWLNFKLSKISRMFDGPLFDNPNYPTNTQDLYAIVQSHLASLR